MADPIQRTAEATEKTAENTATLHEDQKAQHERRTIRAGAQHEAWALEAKGQRRINIMWESTQAFIAIVTTLAVLGSAAWLAYTTGGSEGFVLLASMANLVLGFYFGRSNHTRTGGIGERADDATR